MCLISSRPCARHRAAELSSVVEELSPVGEGEGQQRLAALNWDCPGLATDLVGLIEASIGLA